MNSAGGNDIRINVLPALVKGRTCRINCQSFKLALAFRGLYRLTVSFLSVSSLKVVSNLKR